MSYDLYFWRQTKLIPLTIDQLLDQLGDDQQVDGVTKFPRAGVRSVFKKHFPTILDNDVSLEWEDPSGYFLVQFGHATEKEIHLVTVNCSYDLLKREQIDEPNHRSL